jgi:hypothetical protein
VLNFPVVESKAGCISFKVGYSILTFQQTSNHVGIYHFAFLIPKNKVAEAYAWIQSRTPVLPFNAQSNIADFSNWNAQAFYFHDQHRNILELIAHHDLAFTSDAPFNQNSIIGICEMGLVVEDVSGTCKQLHEDHDSPYFEKGPYLPDFAVMGRADSLLIVSTKGRGWLPTGQAAVPNSVKVLVDVNGKAREIVYVHPVWI